MISEAELIFKLRQVRKYLGYTQEDIAKTCGKSQPWANDFEFGRIDVKLCDYIKIFMFLGLEFSDLEKNVSEMIKKADQAREKEVKILVKQMELALDK